MKRKTTKEFITDAVKVHGDKYGYRLVEYVNNKTKVKIICPAHGEFEQKAGSHLQGYGCSKCRDVISKEKNSLTTDIFIKRSNSRHNNKYDYSLSEYINGKDKIKIICPIHGEFEQRGIDHLNGHGCHKCYLESNKLTTTEFIQRAIEIHGNRYDYSLVDYHDYTTKLTIICPKHGQFKQKPREHLSGGGCRKCHSSVGENKIRLLLTEYDLQFEEEKRFKDCVDKLELPFDFYLPNKNLLIEFNGIQHYEPIPFFGGEDGLTKRIHHDNIKRDYCDINNIELLTIKYNENIVDKLSRLR